MKFRYNALSDWFVKRALYEYKNGTKAVKENWIKVTSHLSSDD